MALFADNAIFRSSAGSIALPAGLSGTFSGGAIGQFASVLAEKALGAGLMMTVVLFLVYAMISTPKHQSVFRSLPSTIERSDLHRLAAGGCLLVAILVANGTYSLIKRMMPLIAPFSWDGTLADIDQSLHFGVAPWRLLHAVVPDLLYPAIEINYLLGWGVYCMGLLVFICYAPAADRSRLRYVLTYLFGFVGIGNILAFGFLSAGPIFYDKVTGDGLRFGALSRFIESGADNPVPVVEVRDFLWNAYSHALPDIGTGISAFPSVHLAMATFGFWLIFEHSRRLGALAFAYLLSILVSSVYLGWHYAIDGYMSITVMTAFHFAARAVESRWPQRSATDEGEVPDLPPDAVSA